MCLSGNAISFAQGMNGNMGFHTSPLSMRPKTEGTCATAPAFAASAAAVTTCQPMSDMLSLKVLVCCDISRHVPHTLQMLRERAEL